MKESQKHIEEIIKLTFDRIKEVYENHREKEGANLDKTVANSRLLFPLYGNKVSTRVSEQELRFLFVEEFNRYCDSNKLNLFYSVETPTMHNYRITGEDCPIVAEDGRSALIDLTIHDENSKRIALIEFKAKNPREKCYSKDFKKLKEESKENNCNTYFLQIVEAHDGGTAANISDKAKKEKIQGVAHECFDISTGEYIIDDLGLNRKI